MTLSPRLSLAAITDEFSPEPEPALDAMAALGMTGAELRVVFGRNIMDLTDAEIDRVRDLADARGIRILGIASPVLKCTLEGGPPVEPHLQQDVFGAKYTFADQAALAERAFDIATRAGARMLRVFSYWRTVDPDACRPQVARALTSLADMAAARGMIVGLENEHACNVATGAETARLLADVSHPALQVIWDPANAHVVGERAFPDGYRRLPVSRIAHVHAKDCRMEGTRPVWGAIGEMDVDWRGQIAALVRDGYAGAISLETHWTGPHGDRMEASTICGRNLAALVAGAAS